MSGSYANTFESMVVDCVYEGHRTEAELAEFICPGYIAHEMTIYGNKAAVYTFEDGSAVFLVLGRSCQQVDLPETK